MDCCLLYRSSDNIMKWKFMNSHSSGLVTWVRNKSYQLDLYFSEQTKVAGDTITLQLGSDAVDLNSGNFCDVTTSSDVHDVNLWGRVLILLSQACDSLFWLLCSNLVMGFLSAPRWLLLFHISNRKVSLSMILTSSKSVLCPLAFKWPKTAKALKGRQNGLVCGVLCVENYNCTDCYITLVKPPSHSARNYSNTLMDRV